MFYSLRLRHSHESQSVRQVTAVELLNPALFVLFDFRSDHNPVVRAGVVRARCRLVQLRILLVTVALQVDTQVDTEEGPQLKLGARGRI